MDNGRIEQIIDKHHCEASALIEILLDIQNELHWLPSDALEMVAEKLQVPMIRIQHTPTFYKAFSLVPKGRHEINVCMGLPAMSGGRRASSRWCRTLPESSPAKPTRT